VFPCDADKKPLVRTGFKAATDAPERARRLFHRKDAVLIGTPTGLRSGLAVLDIDAKQPTAHAWWRQNRRRLSAPCAVRTRSGGLHLYYRHRDGLRNSQGKLACGVDVRAEGGYAIAWWAHGQPVLADAEPAQWPDWMWDALHPPPISWSPVEISDFKADERAERLFVSALARARSAPEGQRHDRLRAAARTIGGLLHQSGMPPASALAIVTEAGIAAGLPKAEAEATARWGLENGIGLPLSLGRLRR
jgi:Bifunctional DNA primase/polymerase, N-terminal